MAKIDCWGKAEAHLADLYGDNSRIAKRFLTEKRWLEKFGAAEYRHLGALATLPLLPVPGARVQIPSTTKKRDRPNGLSRFFGGVRVNKFELSTPLRCSACVSSSSATSTS